VLAVDGDRVKIAVDAPKGVKMGELVEEEEE
jgi:sRNA-binding carbon storage regulator CsrA